MTLIELVISMVIIAVGLVGVMTTFSALVKGSADPLIQKQMLSIAEEMMEEINLKPYVPTANTAAANCARDTWNDVRDYDGYNTAFANCLSGASSSPSKVYDISGTPLTDLNGYAVRVSITDTTVNANKLPPPAQANPIPAANALLITVTVSHGTDSLDLVGWRSNWAQ
jgi:MSHA pilin protein MshD